MGRCRIALVAVLILAACSGGTNASLPRSEPTPEASPEPSPYENPTLGGDLALQIPGMHRAEVRRNLAYVRRDEGPLRMDIYRPRSQAGTIPVVLVGGPPEFSAGKDSAQKIGWGQLIAASGMAAAVFDIRSDDFQASPRAPSEDVRAALNFISRRADALRLDGERICMLGFSIGTAPWHLWAAMKDPAPNVRCNVVYYGPLDFNSHEDWSIEPSLAGEFSALTYLKRDGRAIAPVLIVKAGRDENAGINPSIDRFVATAKDMNAPVELLVHSTGSHGFDVGPGDARTLRIMRRTLSFLTGHLL